MRIMRQLEPILIRFSVGYWLQFHLFQHAYLAPFKFPRHKKLKTSRASPRVVRAAIPSLQPVGRKHSQLKLNQMTTQMIVSMMSMAAPGAAFLQKMDAGATYQANAGANVGANVGATCRTKPICRTSVEAICRTEPICQTKTNVGAIFQSTAKAVPLWGAGEANSQATVAAKLPAVEAKQTSA